ncbi:SHOCT domain-containing protein [Alteromonas sp. CYL-A6]|uniref:SHOCT domain-containing protein n=1 Tax=Alteromonas nitratireducens TaxID=3390813 RepID=UPI0034B8F738
MYEIEVCGTQLECFTFSGLVTSAESNTFQDVYSSTSFNQYGGSTSTTTESYIRNTLFVIDKYGEERSFQPENFRVREGSKVAVVYLGEKGSNRGWPALIKNLDTGDYVYFNLTRVLQRLKVSGTSTYLWPCFLTIFFSGLIGFIGGVREAFWAAVFSAPIGHFLGNKSLEKGMENLKSHLLDFVNQEQDDIKRELVEAIENASRSTPDVKQEETQSLDNNDVVGKLASLKEMLKEGDISQEEFVAFKEKLLAEN